MRQEVIREPVRSANTHIKATVDKKKRKMEKKEMKELIQNQVPAPRI